MITDDVVFIQDVYRAGMSVSGDIWSAMEQGRLELDEEDEETWHRLGFSSYENALPPGFAIAWQGNGYSERS
jgi:hypothetical protein